MWYPRTWDQLKGLEHQAEESANLDFKRQLGSNPETAKDIAALTMNGGVLIYGLDEDKDTRRAEVIVPMMLNGVEEKIRSIAGTRIFPTPEFEPEVIRTPDDDTTGAIVVVVPPSVQAPHWVEGRYPIRRGTITENLTEAEIERLYVQRRDSSHRPSSAEMKGEFHEGFDPGVLEPTSAEGASQALGQARLLVRPLVPEAIVLPGGPWQGAKLAAAVEATWTHIGPTLGNPGVSQVLQKLHDWTAVGVEGWRAGDAATEQRYSLTGESVTGATMSYPGRLSFHLAWGLVLPQQPSAQQVEPDRIARELDVIRDIALCLSLAGTYFAAVPGVSDRGFLLSADHEKSPSRLGVS